MSEEGLVKVRIELPNHWRTGGESLWAKPMGDDLYQIENVPFFAYGLNYQDVVRATSDSPELKPEIQELVKANGHRTFRVFFEKGIDKPGQEEILDSLGQYGVTYERADARYVALDLEPESDFNTVYDRLENFEDLGRLSFETCEARVEGSFDDLQQDD